MNDQQQSRADALTDRSERVESAMKILYSAFIDCTIYAQDALALHAYVEKLERHIRDGTASPVSQPAAAPIDKVTCARMGHGVVSIGECFSPELEEPGIICMELPEQRGIGLDTGDVFPKGLRPPADKILAYISFANPAAIDQTIGVLQRIKAKHFPASSPADGACKRCGSTTAQACNDAGCFYLESGDGEPSAAPADERAAFDLAEFCELIDAYQCAQKDGTHDERAKARFALMNAYRAAASPAAEDADWMLVKRERIAEIQRYANAEFVDSYRGCNLYDEGSLMQNESIGQEALENIRGELQLIEEDTRDRAAAPQLAQAASPGAEEMRDAAMRTVQAMGLVYTPGSDRWRPNPNHAPAAEAVAYVCSASNDFAPIVRDKDSAQRLSDAHGDGKIVPLYAAPQPAQADAQEGLTAGQALYERLHALMPDWYPDEWGDLMPKYQIAYTEAAAASSAAQADAPAEARAKSISDEMMDLADRLGSEWKDVDPRAWQHLLVYAPAEAFPYQKTFNAIAAATSVEGGHVSISVKAFRDAFGGAVAEAREPIAWVTDDGRAITAAQKQSALADGGATASSVRPYSIPCYAVSAPADAGEAAAIVRRQPNGAIAMFKPDGKPFDMSAFVGATFYTAPPAARVASLTDAARDMLAERRRQVEAEGWTPQHDDEHDKGEMARAAACYALHAGSCFAWRADAYQSAKPHEGNPAAQDSLWPWDMQWWKPKDPRRDLVRAGALILAELERLDRAALLNGTDKS